jgi:hypothetical protein
LRALSGFYRVEVRVLSGALKSPANAGLLLFDGLILGLDLTDPTS